MFVVQAPPGKGKLSLQSQTPVSSFTHRRANQHRRSFNESNVESGARLLANQSERARESVRSKTLERCRAKATAFVSVGHRAENGHATSPDTLLKPRGTTYIVAKWKTNVAYGTRNGAKENAQDI